MFRLQIEQRKCALWNSDFGTHGGWDSSLCRTLVTENTGTVCECAGFGTYAVIAEIAHDPQAPDEYTWVQVIKYCGFICSIACLVVFILVIVFTP